MQESLENIREYIDDRIVSNRSLPAPSPVLVDLGPRRTPPCVAPVKTLGLGVKHWSRCRRCRPPPPSLRTAGIPMLQDVVISDRFARVFPESVRSVSKPCNQLRFGGRSVPVGAGHPANPRCAVPTWPGSDAWFRLWGNSLMKGFFVR